MIRYHDEEWGVPAHDEHHLFEMLILEGAQAGLSWSTILRKREAYRRAFDGFDPAMVAHYGERKVARLLADPGIVRNRLKIAAAVTNARVPRGAEIGGLVRPLPLVVRGRQAARHSPPFAGRRPRTNRRVGRAQQGAPEARIQIRRLDDRLRADAGVRAGG